MAKNTKFRRTEKEIKSDKAGGFGTYREDTGGGEPIEKGGKWKPHKKEKRDLSQPRTEDGQFTYNAVNGKPLKEISKGPDGKSRGTTVPPTLTGGQNGVHFKGGTYQTNTKHFDELKKHFEKFDGEFYKKGDEVVFEGHIKIAKEDMLESLQEYVGKHFKDYDVKDWETKKGRHSKSETAAIKGAKGIAKKKGESFVTNIKDGGIANVFKKKNAKEPPKDNSIPPVPTNIQPPLPTPEKHEEEPTQPQTSVSGGITPTQPIQEQQATPKYTPEQIGAMKDVIKEQEGDSYDENYWTDEMISKLIDDYGGASIFEEDNEETEENVLENDNNGNNGNTNANAIPKDIQKLKDTWDGDSTQTAMDYVNKNPELLQKIKSIHAQSADQADQNALSVALEGGMTEDFEKYDSDIIEQFIKAFRKAVFGEEEQEETEDSEKEKASKLFGIDLK